MTRRIWPSSAGRACCTGSTPEFAVGHGAAVHAERRTDTSVAAYRVSTRTVPEYEVPATDVPDPDTGPDLPELADVRLDMTELARLADGPTDGLVAALRPLVTGYRAWIDAREAEADDPLRRLTDHREQVARSLAAARGNQYLDRTLLVDTLADTGCGFFRS